MYTCLFISYKHLAYYFLVNTAVNKLTSFLNKIIITYPIMCSTHGQRHGGDMGDGSPHGLFKYIYIYFI